MVASVRVHPSIVQDCLRRTAKSMYVRMHPEHFFPVYVAGSSIPFLMDSHLLYQIQNRWVETVHPETLDPQRVNHQRFELYQIQNRWPETVDPHRLDPHSKAGADEP